MEINLVEKNGSKFKNVEVMSKADHDDLVRYCVSHALNKRPWYERALINKVALQEEVVYTLTRIYEVRLDWNLNMINTKPKRVPVKKLVRKAVKKKK
jgi:hypothetical protein